MCICVSPSTRPWQTSLGAPGILIIVLTAFCVENSTCTMMKVSMCQRRHECFFFVHQAARKAVEASSYLCEKALKNLMECQKHFRDREEDVAEHHVDLAVRGECCWQEAWNGMN